MGFFNDIINQLLNEGHTVDIACNEVESNRLDFYRQLNCNIYKISTSRSPFSFGNFKAVKQLKKIVNENNYDVVHCHTPIASFCTRLVCKKARKKGTKVIYTAHGFHFYKGSSKLSWLIFYPIEKYLSKFTDILVTINNEDYNLALKKFKSKQIVYLKGVGIDIDKINQVNVNREEKKRQLNIDLNSKVIISVGELNSNKNHQVVIKALSKIEDKNIHYIIAGEGDNYEYLKQLSNDLGLSDRVHLLGYRKDVVELLKICDIFCLPSYREGLSVALMEAMASNLPCLVSNIRGNCDLIDENGGRLFNPNSESDCYEKLKGILNCNLQDMAKYNANKIKDFSMQEVLPKTKKLYEKE